METGAGSPDHHGQPGVGSPWAVDVCWVLQVLALVVLLAAPCWLQAKCVSVSAVGMEWTLVHPPLPTQILVASQRGH